jgi:ATP-binding protein involved in chromosome partitioning
MMAIQLVRQVEWGDLDYLIVDLPPGTADIQQELSKSLDFAGALVVVTPQDVAHLDARKALRMFEQSKVRVLGGVENMSGIVCPHCGQVVDVFARVREDRSIWASGVERLATVPLDPIVSEAGDSGTPLFIGHPHSAAAAAFRELAGKVRDRLGTSGTS